MQSDCFYVNADNMKSNDLIQSPLNYTGGKYKLLPQILPLFPSKIETFVDLFCGGGNVGINSFCNKLILNDINEKLVSLLETFMLIDKECIFDTIHGIIKEYGLSDVGKNGYEYYGCNSSDGLALFNKNSFLKLREEFNESSIIDSNYYLKLYVLIVFAFNNQIRFNSKGKFNLPIGKRDFNKVLQKKLALFIEKLHITNCKFYRLDFRDFDFDKISKNDFVYADPPYLITCATYNEGEGWNEQDELDLLKLLDSLHSKNIRFALSNVLTSKGKKNTILYKWLNSNKQYKCHHLIHNYSNSNYQTKDKTSGSDEVLITNY